MTVILFEVETFEVVAATLVNVASSERGLASLYYGFGPPCPYKEWHREGAINYIYRFVARLQRANELAADARYGEQNEPKTFAYRERLPLPAIGLIKSLHSIRYNIAEAEDERLNAELVKLLSGLTEDYVRSLPAYAATPWV